MDKKNWTSWGWSYAKLKFSLVEFEVEIDVGVEVEVEVELGNMRKPPFGPSKKLKKNERKWKIDLLTPYNTHFLLQNHFLLKNSGCLQKTTGRLKKNAWILLYPRIVITFKPFNGFTNSLFPKKLRKFWFHNPFCAICNIKGLTYCHKPNSPQLNST